MEEGNYTEVINKKIQFKYNPPIIGGFFTYVQQTQTK